MKVQNRAGFLNLASKAVKAAFPSSMHVALAKAAQAAFGGLAAFWGLAAFGGHQFFPKSCS